MSNFFHHRLIRPTSGKSKARSNSNHSIRILSVAILLLLINSVSNKTNAQDKSGSPKSATQSVTNRNVATSESRTDHDFYLSEVKPLLREKCFSCHNAFKQEGGLRLDAASLIKKGGDSGAAIDSGDWRDSLILEKVTEDEDNRMPPAEDGPRITDEEVKKLSGWLENGAAAPAEPIPEHPSKHWSFLRPEKPEVPKYSPNWSRNELDRFLAAEHQRTGVEAVGNAAKSQLLRRAYLALIGLPPTPKELHSFLNDQSESAFEEVVDRLLQSPRYGERWGRHFMDVWRYSDPSGYGAEIRDGRKHIWQWRDWIVESLNSDKGYDRMIVEMLAADEVSPEDDSALRATGFLARNWYKFNRNVWLDNIVEHSSKAFLGLTINCARCHAHKYDPFTQESYYRMRAIFETHDVRDDIPRSAFSNASTSNGQKIVRTYDSDLLRKTYLFLQGDENRPDQSNPLSPGLPELLGELSIKEVQLPVEAWYPALRKENRETILKTARSELTAAEKAIDSVRAQVVAAETKLAAFRPEPQVKNKTPSPSPAITTTKPAPEKLVLSDDFSKLDLKKWKPESGKWSIKNGRLIQSTGLTKQHRLISLTNHPRNFRAKLRLRITGGEVYKSVGIGFDGHGLAMNTVYLSVSGPKVQFSLQDPAGKWAYPVKGKAAHPIQTGKDYELELVVKNQLLNVLIDKKLKVVYQLPPRKAGKISLWAFSATSEFDQFDLWELPATTKLVQSVPNSKPRKVLTQKDLQRALNVARLSEKVAITHRLTIQSKISALKARIKAERIKYQVVEGDQESSAKAAGLASRSLSLNLLSEQIAQTNLKIEQTLQKQEIGPASGLQKTKQELAAAKKQLSELQKKHAKAKSQLNNGSTDYEPVGNRYSKSSSGRRLAFAKWITDTKNPLAARVLVNHVWLRHFGSPLVERTFDFGLRSEKPRHAELLDWLAVQFMEDGWSLKKLHKRILMSGIYRRTSSPAGASGNTRSADPDNLTYWRMNTRRMEAEVVRDSILALGKSLDLTMGGPPIEHTQGQKTLRRSLYFRQDKERQMTFLSLFDGAKVNECYERKATVAPQQALAMFNSQIAAGQSQKIAAIYKDHRGTKLVTAMFEHILCRKPTESELAECRLFLEAFQNSPASRSQLALVLLNHNDFVTIR